MLVNYIQTRFIAYVKQNTGNDTYIINYIYASMIFHAYIVVITKIIIWDTIIAAREEAQVSSFASLRRSRAL